MGFNGQEKKGQCYNCNKSYFDCGYRGVNFCSGWVKRSNEGIDTNAHVTETESGNKRTGDKVDVLVRCNECIYYVDEEARGYGVCINMKSEEKQDVYFDETCEFATPNV